MNGKSIFKIKATLSILLLVDFALVLITGIMMYLGTGPKNVANLHTIAGLLMGLIASVHILLNFKFLIAEIRGKIECGPKNMMHGKK